MSSMPPAGLGGGMKLPFAEGGGAGGGVSSDMLRAVVAGDDTSMVDSYLPFLSMGAGEVTKPPFLPAEPFARFPPLIPFAMLPQPFAMTLAFLERFGLTFGEALFVCKCAGQEVGTVMRSFHLWSLGLF
jgi:hypothetical protein